MLKVFVNEIFLCSYGFCDRCEANLPVEPATCIVLSCIIVKVSNTTLIADAAEGLKDTRYKASYLPCAETFFFK